MKKVNLRDLYPDVYKTDHFVEVTEDVLETIRAAERAEAAYESRRDRRSRGCRPKPCPGQHPARFETAGKAFLG